MSCAWRRKVWCSSNNEACCDKKLSVMADEREERNKGVPQVQSLSEECQELLSRIDLFEYFSCLGHFNLFDLTQYCLKAGTHCWLLYHSRQIANCRDVSLVRPVIASSLGKRFENWQKERCGCLECGLSQFSTWSQTCTTFSFAFSIR